MTSLESENVCFIGQAGVGKTALVERIISHKFNPRPSPTVGVDFFSVPRVSRESGRYTMFVLVDTSGSAQFAPIAFNMLKTARKVVLCYKYGDVQSQQHLIEVVLPAMQERGYAQAEVYVAATMCDDIVSNDDGNDDKWHCPVSQRLLDRGLRVVNGKQCIRTSAKTGFGVQALFNLIKQQHHQQHQQKKKDEEEEVAGGLLQSVRSYVVERSSSVACTLL